MCRAPPVHGKGYLAPSVHGTIDALVEDSPNNPYDYKYGVDGPDSEDKSIIDRKITPSAMFKLLQVRSHTQ